jgi:hypothetical protein
MAKRSVFYVNPSDRGGWNVKKQGAQRTSKHFDKKADAIDYGRQVAKSSELGQLKVQKRDGTFQTEHTYGKDPHPPKG